MTQLSHLKSAGTAGLLQRHSPLESMTPTLFYSCLVSMLTLCHGLPVPADSVKNFVKMQADNIITRIQRHKDELQIFHKMVLDSPELLPELSSDKPIEGLGSMVDTLSTFQSVLHSLPKGHASQLRVDISALQSFLEERARSLQCTHRKATTEKTLEAFLKDNGTYHITLGHVALDRLQIYLQKLTRKLDHLKTC
ncbi:leptin a [Electrophorus electricus]|uniref:leptin a n=1 Tax=Electrophorus electricus TaxID=8005 RepID=UPI0015D0B0C4|nr:leptin a [Electrophorus electricus]